MKSNINILFHTWLPSDLSFPFFCSRLAEEATNGNPEGPDARTLKMISKAAFEVDDYWRIVEILHKRSDFYFKDLIFFFFLFLRFLCVV